MPNRNDRLPASLLPPYLGRAACHALVIALAASALVSGWVRCPIAAYLHVPCPSCGSTRAVRALFALDLRGAFLAHPVAPLLVVLLPVLAARWIMVVLRHGSSRPLADTWGDRLLLRALVLGVALEIVTWAVRFFGFLGGPSPV